MTFTWAQPRSAKNRVPAFLANASPLRYGVAAVILVTVVYSMFYLAPMLHRNLQLLNDVYAVDEAGISLEGQLNAQLQAGRRMFLRTLLSADNPGAMQADMEAMHRYDDLLNQTYAQIAAINQVPEANRREFLDSWHGYLASRDQVLAAAKTGGRHQASPADVDLGKDEFQLAEQAIQDAQVGFRASSATRIAELSKSLNGALREVFVIVGVKVLALALLLWMDWRRIRLEKQLSRAAVNLQASEDRFLHAYETTMVGMGIFSLDGTVLSVNRRGAAMLGYEVEELLGKKVSEFMAPECKEDHVQTIAALPDSPDTSYQVERRVIRKDGSSAWVRNSVTLVQPEGEEGHYFSITEEITEQKEANDKLAYLANYDPVTNLLNRHSFEEKLTKALEETAGTGGCLALLYLEIDSFDFLNGTFGHVVADEVLAELGASLAEFVREEEVVGRLDDHAFALMVKAAPYDEATLARASELRDLFHKASETSKHRIPLSASIGIAYSNDDGGSRNSGRRGAPSSEAETLLKFARAAMLEARSRGGDSIYLADPGLKQRAVQRHQIEMALLNGLREDEFRVVFQPQFQVATGQLVRFEALCRWNSKELGPIPPDRFIPIAEQTGLIMEIGRRILYDALNQAKTWTNAGRRIGVAVNISPMQFMRPDFTNLISEVLAQTQFPPQLLELEITEGIFIRDLNLAVARIRELQRLGLSVALDDFGTGYSSLSYLQKMPIDAVKLDRSFVSDLTTDTATVSMVRSVLAMAEALHLRVVTEGVETEAQLEILRALGCEEAQGYLLGRPESAELALLRVLESPLVSADAVALHGSR